MTKNKIHLAQIAIENAKQAYRKGQRLEARQLASKAIHLNPNSEEPWLVLAALASSDARLYYLRRALALNPVNPVTIRALNARLQLKPAAHSLIKDAPRPSRSDDSGEFQSRKSKRTLSRDRKHPRSPLDSALRYMGILNFGLVGIFAILATNTPIDNILCYAQSISMLQIASPLQNVLMQPIQADSPTSSAISKPTFTAMPTDTIIPSQTASPTPSPTATQTTSPTITETPLPTETPTSVPTNTPLPTETPIPEPTQAIPHPGDNIPSGISDDEHWIDVDLSEQTLYAYSGEQFVNSFVISSGAPYTSTPLGQYTIYIKYRVKSMRGSDYYYPDVPYQMYFNMDYGIHTAYWHNDFGTPVSHGCINMREEDAGWLFDWSSVGTIISIHN
jgi:lipoprotein-anchoring transpeptidase ErfK/SrfK